MSKKMFDILVCNPPYNEEFSANGNKSFAAPVYHEFMDAAYTVADKVELITPARFLFNAGSTPKKWNEKMLNDKHFKVMHYEPSSKEIFANTDITGGIAITYRNEDEDYGAINVFTPFEELNSIIRKINILNDEQSLMSIVYNQNRFNLKIFLSEHPEAIDGIGSNGKDSRFESNIFTKVNCFTDKNINKDDIKVLGVIKNIRKYKYIQKKYVETKHENLSKYKVLVPSSNGSHSLGEVSSLAGTSLIGTPLIGKPFIGYTRTFIGIGSFDTINEAENCLKYIKSKFCRVCLGILKITQSNKKDTWKYVPLQDFTSNSDIDWSVSIADIDKQLYKKYNLSEKEIEFIETHVKEME